MFKHLWSWLMHCNACPPPPSGHFNVESTLNQRQTSTLKQRWNIVGFESWMDVEMTTLNQRRLPDVNSTSGLQRWINADCLTLNQLHIISMQPSLPTITQHSYVTLMQLSMRSSNKMDDEKTETIKYNIETCIRNFGWIIQPLECFYYPTQN